MVRRIWREKGEKVQSVEKGRGPQRRELVGL
jgi:hypothetical protein